MSKEDLIKCPFCGSDELDITTKEPLAMTSNDDDLVRCGNEGCPICDVTMTVKAWNRRYVCDDKHGKPVYAGDRARAAGFEGKADRLGGIRIESEDGHLHHVWPSEIELIQEKT